MNNYNIMQKSEILENRLLSRISTQSLYDHEDVSIEPEESLQDEYNDHCQTSNTWSAYSITRAIVLSNYVNIFLIFVPLAILCGFFKWNHTITFIFNFIAIIPLAAVLSFVTEELSINVGQTTGSLLNASLGNVVELIIAIIALNKGQLRIVQTSMIGSILSNDLLVLGICFIAGGLYYREQKFNMTAAQTMSSLMAVATSSLLIPAAFRLSLPSTDETNKNIIILSRGTSIFLLIIYFLYLIFQLKTHTEFYDTVIEDTHKESIPPIISGILLILVTFLVSVCAEYLIDSIDLFVTSHNVNKTFIGLILIPIVGKVIRDIIDLKFITLGNAAEHVTAVIVSMKNKMDLAIGVALGSSMQIALFITPSLIIIGWIIGQPLTLYFKTFETVIMFISVFIINYLIQDGKSNWLEGIMLITVYCIISIAFFLYPEQKAKTSISEEDLNEKFHEIDPYFVLKVSKNATQAEIRSAYRKQALLNHPDKKPESEKKEANIKFEEIAFAYGILNDEKRRKKYDTTGRVDEVVDDIDWSEWVKDLYKGVVDGSTLEEFKKSYQGSDEEKQDLYLAYEQCKGSMEDIFSYVLCSNMLLDEERFRVMIDEGIERKELKKYKNYTQETASQKKKRHNKARREAIEAEELAKELGLDKTLKKIKEEDQLQALIQQRQTTRMKTLIDSLESKYGNPKKKSSKKQVSNK
ncbi:hypothetical protein PORY_001624 [Pneumocystis oryctolagi]|uniref:Uncharacterized protein n=1 Tax=Pneumocystis oryctolagi TaxID=42067 RepID=A0ACB7CDK5_9ASCO|nr:hypothetical protein PORY_001624 [Pneumocystis oryctolagi]